MGAATIKMPERVFGTLRPPERVRERQHRRRCGFSRSEMSQCTRPSARLPHGSAAKSGAVSMQRDGTAFPRYYPGRRVCRGVERMTSHDNP
jgi:hypothetical protein